MDDLISRAAAIKAMSTWDWQELYLPIHFKQLLEELPSAQTEIIRCNDCKHWGERGLCDKWDYYISNGDFYCGCAERRADENNNE